MTDLQWHFTGFMQKHYLFNEQFHTKFSSTTDSLPIRVFRPNRSDFSPRVVSLSHVDLQRSYGCLPWTIFVIFASLKSNLAIFSQSEKVQEKAIKKKMQLKMENSFCHCSSLASHKSKISSYSLTPQQFRRICAVTAQGDNSNEGPKTDIDLWKEFVRREDPREQKESCSVINRFQF